MKSKRLFQVPCHYSQAFPEQEGSDMALLFYSSCKCNSQNRKGKGELGIALAVKDFRIFKTVYRRHDPGFLEKTRL